MRNSPPRGDNPEGLGDVDPMSDLRYAELLRAYSDRLRRVTGVAPLPLWERRNEDRGEAPQGTTVHRTPVPG